uniref:Ovule protein n=1 Tax=Ascaris lumbricoides TaxID=6252 RepID=A0A0M3I8X8_ASCLU
LCSVEFRCIFCLDYDDYHGLSIFGCNVATPLTCFGNSCYMSKWQHKKNNFFLYTSGCLNFTSDEYEILSERRRAGRVVRGATGRETQLCEVNYLPLNSLLLLSKNK